MGWDSRTKNENGRRSSRRPFFDFWTGNFLYALLRAGDLGPAFLLGRDLLGGFLLRLPLRLRLGLRLGGRILGLLPGLRLPGLLGLLGRLGLGGGRLALDQLQHRHLGPVTLTRSELDDAQVAARPLGEARRDLVEYLLDQIALQHPA